MITASVKFCYVLGSPSLKMSEGTPSQQGTAPCPSFHVPAHFQAEAFYSLTQDLLLHLSSQTYGSQLLFPSYAPRQPPWITPARLNTAPGERGRLRQQV